MNYAEKIESSANPTEAKQSSPRIVQTVKFLPSEMSRPFPSNIPLGILGSNNVSTMKVLDLSTTKRLLDDSFGDTRCRNDIQLPTDSRQLAAETASKILLLLSNPAIGISQANLAEGIPTQLLSFGGSTIFPDTTRHELLKNNSRDFTRSAEEDIDYGVNAQVQPNDDYVDAHFTNKTCIRLAPPDTSRKTYESKMDIDNNLQRTKRQSSSRSVSPEDSRYFRQQSNLHKRYKTRNGYSPNSRMNMNNSSRYRGDSRANDRGDTHANEREVTYANDRGESYGRFSQSKRNPPVYIRRRRTRTPSPTSSVEDEQKQNSRFYKPKKAGSLQDAIRVRNLPERSTDAALKDGLFHTYRKIGHVSWVQIMGYGLNRYAIVCFTCYEDFVKALKESKNKEFFGNKLIVSPYYNGHPDIERFLGILDDDTNADGENQNAVDYQASVNEHETHEMDTINKVSEDKQLDISENGQHTIVNPLNGIDAHEQNKELTLHKNLVNEISNPNSATYILDLTQEHGSFDRKNDAKNLVTKINSTPSPSPSTYSNEIKTHFENAKHAKETTKIKETFNNRIDLGKHKQNQGLITSFQVPKPTRKPMDILDLSDIMSDDGKPPLVMSLLKRPGQYEKRLGEAIKALVTAQAELHDKEMIGNKHVGLTLSPEQHKDEVGCNETKEISSPIKTFDTPKILKKEEPKIIIKEEVTSVEEEYGANTPTRTVLITNIVLTVNMAEVKSVFDQYGEIVNVDIRSHAGTLYAICEFLDISSAMRAKWGRHVFNGKEAHISFFRNSPTTALLLDGIAGLTEMKLGKYCAKYGQVKTVLIDPIRFVALVQYKDVVCAEDALIQLGNWIVNGKKLDVDFASPQVIIKFQARLKSDLRNKSLTIREFSSTVSTPVHVDSILDPRIRSRLMRENLGTELPRVGKQH